VLTSHEDSSKNADAYECLTSGAKVNVKVLKSARNGEFVNLTDFALILEPTNVTEATVIEGELVFKSKRQIKTLDSFLMWSLAWRGYEEYLMECNPSLYKQLVAYRVFIQTTAAKYHWQAVYAYDIRNRSKHSMTRSLEFHQVDTDIYVACLDSSTARSNIRQCARCKSIWHITKDCPFPTINPMETSSRETSSSTPVARQQNNNRPPRFSQQPCFAWNSGRCFNSACTRLQVCQGCGGPDPIYRCKNCSSQSKQHLSAGASNFVPGHNTSSASGGYPSQQARMGSQA
jgi:hypothetical protein